MTEVADAREKATESHIAVSVARRRNSLRLARLGLPIAVILRSRNNTKVNRRPEAKRTPAVANIPPKNLDCSVSANAIESS